VNYPWFSNLVSSDGNLNPEHLLQRQPIYRGRNGRVVERIHISTPQGKQSYIFKPLTNLMNMSKEQWSQHHLLAGTSIPYPRLLAASEQLEPETYWTIFEDLGELNHQLSEENYMAAARLIPLWHGIPLMKVPPDYRGDKPDLSTSIDSVKQSWDLIASSLLQLKIDLTQINRLFSIVESAQGLTGEEMVISHGDLCFGNVGISNSVMFVLDWEFVHRNSIFWDLYCLLDMTHPLERKTMNNRLRDQVLSAYIEERQAQGLPPVQANFKTNYAIFAVVYAIWMLLLIEHDLQSKVWAKSGLLASQIEIASKLNDHLDVI
jgi:thiamine kinase-like enzyme